MHKAGNIELIDNILQDKRCNNSFIPQRVIMTLSIGAKMKRKLNLTDIPFAIRSSELLKELKWNIKYNNEKENLFSEGTIRNYVNKYESQDFINLYNNYVPLFLEKHGMSTKVHILDCSEILVNPDNPNYENSEVVKDEEGISRGYKLVTLRGVYGILRVLKQIGIESINNHDLKCCENLLEKSKILKPGDILICDRGFISREFLNNLKLNRNVNVYIPVKSNMDIYKEAVEIAKMQNKRSKHPNKKRNKQKIQLVKDLGVYWRSNNPENDVPLSACVVWEIKKVRRLPNYYVFVTTDTEKNAEHIVNTYEIRANIEEDYRQVKHFWQIEKFCKT